MVQASSDDEQAAMLLDIPIVVDELTFDQSVAVQTQKMDDEADNERRRQWRRWRHEVDMMQQEITTLDE